MERINSNEPAESADSDTPALEEIRSTGECVEQLPDRHTGVSHDGHHDKTTRRLSTPHLSTQRSTAHANRTRSQQLTSLIARSDAIRAHRSSSRPQNAKIGDPVNSRQVNNAMRQFKQRKR